jgi:subtilisin family serine protease
VGSYDWNDSFERFGRNYLQFDPEFEDAQPLMIGNLSSYSNPGPLRFGESLKPEVVAPGQYYTAPVPLNVPADRDTSGHYQLFNGTSAATPYVAGVIALVLEKNPNITLGQVKKLLQHSATKDRFTGPLPSGKWGHGKLDEAAVRRMLVAQHAR